MVHTLITAETMDYHLPRTINLLCLPYIRDRGVKMGKMDGLYGLRATVFVPGPETGGGRTDP
jgi:hypothetical protein